MKELVNIRQILCLVLVCLRFASYSQPGLFVNRDYEDDSGNPTFNPILNPFGFQWSNSIVSGSGEIFTVGHSNVSGQGENVFLTKRDPDGNIIFQFDYNTSGTQNDYGLGLCQASNGDILICGATDNGGSTNYDIVVLRVDPSGTLVNSIIKDRGGMNDFAVGILEGPGGNFFVAANSEASPGIFDYWALKLNPSLSFSGDNTYDYTGLQDIAIGIEFTVSGDIALIGASFSGLTSCDYAMAMFDQNMSYISDKRNNLPGTALDQAISFCKDAGNNTYITGKAWNGTDFDIKTIKITSAFTIAWTITTDVNGLDDVPSSIAVDASGNVIVGGFATNSGSTKNIFCQKYNGSSGSIMWQHKQSSEDPAGDASIAKLCINPNTGDVYFVGVEKRQNGGKQVVTRKIKSGGGASWQRTIGDDASLDYLPSDIKWEAGSVFVISIKDSTTNSYLTTKYSEFQMSTTAKTYGNAKFVSKQLIVRFLPSALNTTAIDNSSGTSRRDFANLKDFMAPTAYATVTAALVDICREDIMAMKVFPGHASTFTETVNRLGDPVAIPNLWTTLLLEIPCESKLFEANTIFNGLTTIAAYAHPNYLVQLYSTPNDSLWTQQLSLHNNTVFPGADVNADEGWDVFPRGGRETVRGGVFDVGVDWEHKEFNYNGTNPSTSKIRDGYSFSANALTKTLPNGGCFGNLHATAIAGIIGAQRNNSRGVAGIAGGNSTTGSEGVSMYDISLWDPSGSAWLLNLAPMNYVSDAMVWSTQNPASTSNPTTKKYCFELHFQNHSWGLLPPPSDTGYFAFHIEDIKLFSEASRLVARMNVTSIVARGNNSGTVASYPASCEDDWVLNVSGTGVNGNFAHLNVAPFSGANAELTSAWGGDIDVAAPCTGSLITTLSTPGATIVGQGSVYNSFGGTSAAAPHVSGAVGLMQSYLNDTIVNFPNNKANMAPEDCEAILQLTATDTDTSGYDQLTGHGRLNVGKAMRLIEKPWHRLLHFDTDVNNSYSYSKNVTASSTWDTIRTTERFYNQPSQVWFQKGKYIVKKYEINTTVNHNITVLDTIIGYWPRPSSAVTFPDISNGKIMPREKTKIITINNSAASLRGWVYQVKDSIGNPKGWWPVDTGFTSAASPFGKWSAYSVLTKNYGNPVGISEKNKFENGILVFPNPTNGRQTLVVETTKEYDLTVDIYDIMGRKVKSVYSGKSEPLHTIINHDVSGLSNSLYIYNISLDGNVTTRKFIKQ